MAPRPEFHPIIPGRNHLRACGPCPIGRLVNLAETAKASPEENADKTPDNRHRDLHTARRNRRWLTGRFSGRGLWLSLVERLTGGQEVVGSNPASPTVKPRGLSAFRPVPGRAGLALPEPTPHLPG